MLQAESSKIVQIVPNLINEVSKKTSWQAVNLQHAHKKDKILKPRNCHGIVALNFVYDFDHPNTHLWQISHDDSENLGFVQWRSQRGAIPPSNPGKKLDDRERRTNSWLPHS